MYIPPAYAQVLGWGVLAYLREVSAYLLVQLRWAIPGPQIANEQKYGPHAFLYHHFNANEWTRRHKLMQ